MMSSSGPHKIILLLGSLHSVTSYNPPVSSSQNIKRLKILVAPGIFISLTQKQYNSLKEFVCPTCSFISLHLAGS